MRFRKRPIEIEAEQWTPEKQVDGVTLRPDGTGWIETLEGGHIVSPGDWIITGVAGEKYPCKPDIFARTYDLVSSGNQTELSL